MSKNKKNQVPGMRHVAKPPVVRGGGMRVSSVRTTLVLNVRNSLLAISTATGGRTTFAQFGSRTGTDEVLLRRRLVTMMHQGFFTFDMRTGEFVRTEKKA